METIILIVIVLSMFLLSFFPVDYKHIRWRWVRKLTIALTVLLLGSTTVWGQTPLQVGEVYPYSAESPHPYPAGAGDRPVVWSEEITSPGAQFIRIHFRGFALASGDYVTVSNLDGSDFWTYTGKGPKSRGNFWSFAVKGDTAIVDIHAGPRNEHGFHIDAIGHGYEDRFISEPTPEVLCGTDGRENVACYTADNVFKPVARLLFVSGAFQYVCTGWLVDGANDSTAMTNNHCFSTQKEVDTVQATFNFQRTECFGSINEDTNDYAGGVLLKTNPLNRKRKSGGLDYTLFTLIGNPEGFWGELHPTNRDVPLNEKFWFIQHPGGNEKKVGAYEDSAHTTRCHVAETDQTYGRSAQNSQMGYGCDSQGGSSGSPIVDTSGDVIALHHFGNVSSGSCLNGGTLMSYICDDAGSLINCGATPPTSCSLGAVGDTCTSDGDCCSNKCKGKPGAKTCK